jgi:transcriptional regulator CtsR
MRAVINDKTLVIAPEEKGRLRAQLLRNMLIAVVQ